MEVQYALVDPYNTDLVDIGTGEPLIFRRYIVDVLKTRRNLIKNKTKS